MSIIDDKIDKFKSLLKSHFRNDYDIWFEEIANMLMNNFQLKVGENYYRIIECEFYYHSEKHPDVNTHQKEEQFQFCEWYFNDFGLDITFGSKDEKIYGGILIRGIKKIDRNVFDNNFYISGPMKVLRELIKNSGTIFSNTGINLIPNNEGFQDNKIYKSTRVNLSKYEFKNYMYRFLVELNSSHKFKEREIVAKNNGLSIDEQKKLLGYVINDFKPNDNR